MIQEQKEETETLQINRPKREKSSDFIFPAKKLV